MSGATGARLRILITGSDGQVGHELARTMTELGDVTAMSRSGLDLCSDDSIRAAVRQVRPHLIVNAAAYTAVDRAESEPELAMRVNAEAVATLADEAKRAGAAMIHYSTDYVFDGSKPMPYVENDATNPLSVYGKTKLEGERALAGSGAPYLIFRTSWVYGSRGKNFLRTILRHSVEKPELRIVDDQIGAPTWSRDIAEATAAVTRVWMNDTDRRTGVYHLTNSGETTWYGFAVEALRLHEQATNSGPRLARLVPISTVEYPTPAVRPKNSRLNCEKLECDFRCRLPEWRDSLARVMAEIAADEARDALTAGVQAAR